MSEQPFVQEFEMPDGRVVTSVVMDREEFETLIDELIKAEIHGLTPDVAGQVKELGHIPLMGRGAKTEFVFERYGATGKMISIIIRGQGRFIAERFMEAIEQQLTEAYEQQMRRQIESN